MIKQSLGKKNGMMKKRNEELNRREAEILQDNLGGLSEADMQALEQAYGQDRGISPLGLMYPQSNVKEVIQEYTKEDTTPKDIKKTFWGLSSNSLVWGFNDPASAMDYRDNFEMAQLWDIMKDPEQEFSWERGQDLLQADFVLAARINRSILRPSGGMNERMAEISQVQQNISSSHVTEGRSGGTGAIDKIRDGIGKIIR